MRQLMNFLSVIMMSLILVISGCASVPEPQSGNSLIIGKIYQIGVGYPSNNGSRLNGKHTTGVILTFENIESGEWIDLRSYRGKYYSTGFTAGRYRLINLHLEVKDDSGTNSAGMRFSSQEFEVEGNAAYNIGEIELVFDFKKGLSYQQNQNYEETKAEFFEDEQSGWLGTNWNDVQL